MPIIKHPRHRISIASHHLFGVKLLLFLGNVFRKVNLIDSKLRGIDIKAPLGRIFVRALDDFTVRNGLRRLGFLPTMCVGLKQLLFPLFFFEAHQNGVSVHQDRSFYQHAVCRQ